MKEIRFHGRGGQGAVTAAELLAVSVGYSGKYSQAFPFFGVERRGAPVMSFCRLDEKPIRMHQQVYEPDVIVVLDPTLDPKMMNKGLKVDGIAVINTKQAAGETGISAAKIYTVDATGIALKNLGRPIINTAMLGAFAKATGLVNLEDIKKAVGERFSGPLAEKNIKAVEECYNEVK
jgi:pyruvate ferredoxin oxidoreductase gamma subunit/2-oxoisovalerate ferredoxin oxidoreductase gamma subunit